MLVTTSQALSLMIIIFPSVYRHLAAVETRLMAFLKTLSAHPSEPLTGAHQFQKLQDLGNIRT